MSDSGNDHSAHGDHGHGHGEATYPYTPHHFHSAKQHFESGKMGVWLFLVTEILFFAGLFCAYTIYRGQHPEVFYWAHFYLDTFWGAANTVVLLASSLTAAWAVRNAQLGQKRLLQMNILLTICGALFFMCVKYVEYSHKFHDGLLPARHFAPHHEVWETPSFKKMHPESAKAAERIVAGLAERKAQKSAVRDEVISKDSPLALVPVVDVPADVSPTPAAASKAGPTDASSTKTAPVPAKAVAPTAATTSVPTAATTSAQAAATPTTASSENEAATDAAVAGDAVAEPLAEAATAEGAAEADESKAKAAPSPAKAEVPDDIWLETQVRNLTAEERHPLEMAGVIRKPADGPLVFERPAKAGIFFSIYFFMTGLHGVHVVIGIGLWIWMLAIVSKRKTGDKYFGPIDFTALYWHLVDLIWIYLFPMLYLIH